MVPLGGKGSIKKGKGFGRAGRDGKDLSSWAEE